MRKTYYLPLIAFCILTFTINKSAYSAARYWVANSASNWNSTANWSTTSGGSGGASIPTAADDVYFNSSKPAGCNIDISATVNSMTISSGYTGTITQGAGIPLVINVAYTQNAGTFAGSNANITIGGGLTFSSGTFTSTSATLFVASGWNHSSGTFNHNNGLVQFTGNSYTLDISSASAGTEIFNNLTINLNGGNTLNISSNDIVRINGTLSLYDGAASFITNAGYFDAKQTVNVSPYWDGGNYPLNFTGTGSQTFTLNSTSAYKGNITINKSSGDVVMGSNLYLNNSGMSLYLLSGTLNLNGFIVEVYNSTYATGTIFGPSTGATFTVAGSGSLNTYNYSQTNGTSNFTFSGSSAFSTYGSFTLSAGTLSANTATMTHSGNFTLSGGTYNAPSNNMNIYGNWTHTSGVFNHNNGTANFYGNTSTLNISGASAGVETFNNLIINLNGSNTINVSAGDILKSMGTLNLYDGAVSYISTSGYFEALGNVTISPYWDGGNLPLHFKGGSAQSFTLAATSAFKGNVVINKSGSAVTMLSSLYLNNSGMTLSLLSGTLNLNSYTVEVYNGAYANGTIYGPSASTTFTIMGPGSINGYNYIQNATSSTLTFGSAANFNIYGAFTHSVGSMNCNASTVTVSQNFTINGGVFNAPSGNLNIYGNWTHSSGSFNHNSGSVNFYGNTSTVDISGASAGTDIFNNLTINLNGGNTLNISASDVLRTLGTLTLYDGAASFISTAGYFDAQGNVTVSPYWDGGNLPLVFSGIAAQIFSLSATTAFKGNITINKSANAVTMGSSLYLNNSGMTLSLLSGTLNLNGNIVEIYNGSYANGTLNGPSASTTFTVSGTGSLRCYNYIQNNTGSLLSISSASTFQTYNAFTIGAGTFTPNGATVTIGGGINISGAGTVMNAPTGALNIYGTWNHPSTGTFNHSNGTVNYYGNSASMVLGSTETFNNLLINLNGGNTLTLSGSVRAKTIGLLTLYDGAASSGIFEPQGNVFFSPYWDGGNAELIFTGSAAQNFDLGASTSACKGDVTINKTGGAVTMLSNLYLSNSGMSLRFLAGTINLNGYTVQVYNSSYANGSLYGPATSANFTVNGPGTLNTYNYFQSNAGSNISLAVAPTFNIYNSFSLTNGTFTANGALIVISGAMSLSGASTVFNAPTTNLNLYGNYTHSSGTFNHSNGTVNFYGTSSTYDISGLGSGTETLYKFIVNKNSNNTLTVTGGSATLAIASDFTVSSGIFSAPPKLNVGGNFTINNSGTYTGNTGLLTFTGDDATLTGGAGGALTFYEWKINKNAGKKLTIGNATTNNITNKITFTQGNFVTSAWTNIILACTGSIVMENSPNTCTSSSFVEGPITRTLCATGSLFYPVGKNGNYRPLTLTTVPQGASTMFTAEQFEGNDPGWCLPAGICRVSKVRYFRITLNGNLPVRDPITLSYCTDDGVTHPNNLRILKQNGNCWVNLGGKGTSAGSGTITSTVDFTTYGDFIIADSGCVNPLPVEMMSFTGKLIGGVAQLNWATASELNNDRFEVERSYDAKNWIKISSVKGFGTTNSIQNYAYNDASAFQNGSTVYYRLKQVDYNGEFEYSSTVVLASNFASGEKSFKVYPNPANTTLHVESVNANKTDGEYKLLDLNGKVLVQGNFNQMLTMPLTDIAPGLYFIQINSNDGEVLLREKLFVKR